MELGDGVVTIEGLNAWRGAGQVLHGVNLKVGRGEAVAVVGRNGVGKTTLVESIFQMGPRTSGVVTFGGQNLDQMVTSDLMQLGIALVPQGRRLFRSLTVEEHLVLAGRKASSFQMEAIFEEFPILGQRRRSHATKLSGGEQSILAIARAVAAEPKLVVMDEPTEGLAPILVAQIRAKLLDMKSRGVSILLIEQNLDFAIHVCDRLAVMDRGAIVQEFDTTEIPDLEAIRRLIVLGETEI